MDKDYHQAGLVVRESGSGELILFEQHPTGMNVAWWASATSFSSGKRSADVHFPYEWMQIEDNNTNLIFRYSRDGHTFLEFYSESRTAHLTPDQIGFHVQARNASAPDLSVAMSILSWAVT
jgi:hypothetical protein